MNWLRWYHGTVNDPKWRSVSKITGCPIHQIVAVWAALLENASDSEQRGTVTNWSDEDIATVLDLPVETVERICNAMKRRETLVTVSPVSFRISAWEKRNPRRERVDDSSERVQRFRDKKRHVTPRNATKRPEERREDTKEKKEEAAPYSSDFEVFWKAYPSKTGKGDAFASWKKNGHPPVEKLVEILEHAKQSKKWKEGIIPNPATWLNQKRWDDDYGPLFSAERKVVC